MLWLVDAKEEESFCIVRTNLAIGKEGEHQLWVEKFNGRTKKIRSSDKVEEILEVKQAIDFAIERGETVLRI